MSDWHCQKIYIYIPCFVLLLCAPLSSSVLYAACDTVSPVSPASVTRRGHRGPIRAQMSGGGGTHRVWGGWQTRAVLLEMAENVLYKFKILQCVTTSNARILLFLFSYSKDQFLTWPNMENFFLSILFPKEFKTGQQPPAQLAHLIRLLWLA